MRPLCPLILILLFIVKSKGQDTLLLFHPTAYNLEVISGLAEDGMLCLDGYHLLGVYHSGENYDFSQSDEWLKKHHDFPGSLREIEGFLGPGELFSSNECTQDFLELFSRSRSALFMGGPDIPPTVYNESVHLLTMVTDPHRHYLELSFLFHLLGGSQDPQWVPYLAREKKYLVSGICLGMQTMNVATGGTMVQDIPTEIYGVWTAEDLLGMPPDMVHRNYNDKVGNVCTDPTSYHFHRIDPVKDSFVSKELKQGNERAPLVLSSHHQAIEEMGSGWKTAARSMDGKIIEAIEHKDYPNVFGVQFHPEKPGLFDPAIEHPQRCDSLIRFNDVIRETDSYNFHLAYWNYIGTLLQKNRSENHRIRKRANHR